MTVEELKRGLQMRLQGLSTQATAMQLHANDVDVLALTLIGEARSESFDGRIAVAQTVRNRVAEHGGTIADRCLQKWQFSCWNEAMDKNHSNLMLFAASLLDRTLTASSDQQLLREMRYLAGGVIDGALRDNTGGATHYLTNWLLANKPPSWVHGHTPSRVIGAHSFFTGIAWA